MTPFDIITKVDPASYPQYVILGLVLLYVILIRFIETKQFYDPFYLKKCSSGSFIEVCMMFSNKKRFVLICKFWKVSCSVLTAIIYLDLSWIILTNAFAVSLPSNYMLILMFVFLVFIVFVYLAKLILYVLLKKETTHYCRLKLTDCFH